MPAAPTDGDGQIDDLSYFFKALTVWLERPF